MRKRPALWEERGRAVGLRNGPWADKKSLSFIAIYSPLCFLGRFSERAYCATFQAVLESGPSSECCHRP